MKFIKTLIYKLYVLALMAFAIWFGTFIYPLIYGHAGDDVHAEVGSEEEVASFFGEGTTEEEKQLLSALKDQNRTAVINLGYTVVQEQYVQGHFHHIGMTIEADDTNLCVRCHGSVPHDKAKAIRAFLNMHAFYTACETCHILPNKEKKQKWVFRWYDKRNGKVIPNPADLTTQNTSMYGNYGAKIGPGLISPATGNFHFLNGEKEHNFVEKYLREKDRLDSTMQSQMKKVIHRQVNEKPLLCNACHNEERPYLDFVALGYPRSRLLDLTGSEVVGMVDRYQEFYMPNLLMPGQGRK